MTDNNETRPAVKVGKTLAASYFIGALVFIIIFSIFLTLGLTFFVFLVLAAIFIPLMIYLHVSIRRYLDRNATFSVTIDETAIRLFKKEKEVASLSIPDIQSAANYCVAYDLDRKTLPGMKSRGILDIYTIKSGSTTTTLYVEGPWTYSGQEMVLPPDCRIIESAGELKNMTGRKSWFRISREDGDRIVERLKESGIPLVEQ